MLNLFYFTSFISVFFALLMVFSKNPVHSVLYLILTFVSIFCHYILLNAEFVAYVHLIVYAGAIMVLFLYVIMMLNLNYEDEPHKSNVLKIAATISAGLLMIILVGTLKGTELMPQQQSQEIEVGMVKNLGRILFKEYLLPFEITSILLLAAMVGAVMLGKHSKTKDAE